MLRRHRLAAGLTQKEVAERAGVSLRALRDLEQGRTRQPRAIAGLAGALRLSPAERAALIDTLTAARAAAGSSRIGVLGPLQVIRDGRPAAVASLRQRTMLGLLALHRGQAVKTDDIIDVVWGEDPPRTVRNLIQSCVSDLRALLGAAGRGLRLANGGYCLMLPGQDLDLDRFDDLVARARTAGSNGQARQAADLFAQALSCWRGPIVADADDRLRRHPAAVAAGRRRIAATVAFADVAVAQGDGERVIGALRALSHEDPLHEAVHGRLMLALAATGEQAAALRLYAELRSRLADELGVEPGAEIQAAHLRLLRADAQAHRIEAGPVADPAISPGGRFAATHLVGLRSGLQRSRGAAAAGTAPAASPAAPSRTDFASLAQVSARLTTPRPGRAPAGPQTPRQLPREVTSFAGRRGEIAALDRLLAAAPGVVVISGMAGVGKTALAVHWAHRVAERFPDGQLFVNLRGFEPAGPAMSPTEAIRRFLDAFGVPAANIPAHPDAQADLYRSLVAGKRMLVVLDNARDPDQVRPLLPGAPGCQVLVTSRQCLTGLVAAEGAHSLPLDSLTHDEARDLLGGRLGAHRLTGEPGTTDELIARCARLPLALSIVAANAAIRPHLPLTALADQLRHAHDRLDALSTGDTAATDLRAVFSWSYRTLGEDSARMFRLLGLHPGPDISVAAAASLAALPADRTRPLLKQLADAHLIAEHTPGRYTFHDLLRVYATGLAHTTDRGQARDAATGRLLDHYLHTAFAAARLLDPARDPITLAAPRSGLSPEHIADHQHALDWFAAERPALLACVEHAAGNGFDAHTWQLAWSLWTYLHKGAHWHDVAATQHAAVIAAERVGHVAGQAHARRNLARAYSRLGRLDDAHAQLRRCLDLDSRGVYEVGQGHTHLSLAMLFERQRRLTEALDHARQALDLFLKVGHQRGQALSRNAIGWHHALLGDYPQALAQCRQALSLHQRLGDRIGEAHTWDSIGYAHHHLGRHAEAVASYQKALDLERYLGDPHREAKILSSLGDAHHASNSLAAARHAWEQALSILDGLGDPGAGQVRAKLCGLGAAGSMAGARNRPPV